MILGIPEIIENEKTSRLVCNVTVGKEVREIWFEVDKEYGQYLCADRVDAFVIGLLSWAMRNGEDIICKAPITEMLLYNIEKFLLPSVIKNAKNLHCPTIYANTIDNIKDTAGAVGTGASCGIDSFHTIMNHLNSKFESMNLTHLCLNNVGAYNSAHDAESVRTAVIWRAQKAAEELNLKLLSTNSNFAEVFPQNHLLTNTYTSMFAVFCLQKLWKVYYYSSGSDFSHFSLKENDLHDTAYYDLLLLDCFSLPNIKLYSEGATKTRFEKIQQVSSFPLAKKYLHVCIRKETNCGKCDKCKKTILVFDAIGKLKEFNQVFDTEQYDRERDRYLGLDCIKKDIGNMYYNDIYNVIKDDPQMKQVEKRLQEHVKQCVQQLQGKKLVIYGAGEVGLMLYTLLKKEGYDQLLYWIDKNDTLHGRKKVGIPILSYEEWKKVAKDLDLSEICMIISVIRQSNAVTQKIREDFGDKLEIVERSKIAFDWLEDV